MLYRDDDEVAIPPKAVETVAALVERNGEIISMDELMEAVWADTVVEESNLARYIHLLRSTLGNQQDGKTYIDTCRRRGYRFNGQVAVRARSEAVDVSAGRAALSKDSHAFRREGITGKVVSISDWQASSLAELDRAPRHNLPAPAFVLCRPCFRDRRAEGAPVERRHSPGYAHRPRRDW